MDCPLVWNHSSDARDRCGKVVAVIEDGKTLYADIEVPDEETAKKVCLCQVSVGHADRWVDGEFNIYDDFLLHVGVVNHPVVPGQGPFKELSLMAAASRKPRYAVSIVSGQIRKRMLAADEQPAPTETVVEDIASGTIPTATDSTLTDLVPRFEKLIKLINVPGIELPANVTEENLLPTLDMIIAFLEKMQAASSGETPADAATAPVEAIEAASPDTMNYASLLKFSKGLKTRTLAIEVKARNEKELAFTRELDELCKGGILSTVDRDAYLELGKVRRFDTAILNPIKTLSAKIPVNSKTRHLANGGEPTVGDGQKSIRDAGREFFGIKKKQSA